MLMKSQFDSGTVGRPAGTGPGVVNIPESSPAANAESWAGEAMRARRMRRLRRVARAAHRPVAGWCVRTW
jgi:hypothetical protein